MAFTEQLEQSANGSVTSRRPGPSRKGAPGAFTVQLILDNGVDEYVLRPTADDTEVLLQLLQRSDHATFDLGRRC